MSRSLNSCDMFHNVILKRGLYHMLNNINVLNFDHVYQDQVFLNKEKCNWISLQSIPNTNLLCEKDTLRKIAKRLVYYKNSKLTMIGSGNYHYMTYLLLLKIQKPFTLVLFDHHTDTLKSPGDDLISCGSWVLESLQNIPKLEKVIIIGVSEDGEKYIPPSMERKVSLYTEHHLHYNFAKSCKSIIREIPTDEVYLSIDKDVLDKRDAITTWDQGTMRLRQLMRIVKEIIKSKTISGVDICGEYPVNPLNEFAQQTKDANEKNSYANQFIIRRLQSWIKQVRQSDKLLHA